MVSGIACGVLLPKVLNVEVGQHMTGTLGQSSAVFGGAKLCLKK
jgi:hypothetical protein